MSFVALQDREEIETFLRKDLYLHLYSIGDLDDSFWPHTTWYGLKGREGIRALALLYSGLSLPTLLGLTNTDGEMPMRDLLSSLVDVLPGRFYAHLSPGVEEALAGKYHLEPHGLHLKMALLDSSRVKEIDCKEVVELSEADTGDLLALYKQSYPGNWFEPQMLKIGRYFGIRRRGDLLCAAGTHVYSRRQGVAALGNITTHPQHRRRGLGRAATACLCKALLREVRHIGLNVKADNQAAISLYEYLGFAVIARYGEYSCSCM